MLYHQSLVRKGLFLSGVLLFTAIVSAQKPCTNYLLQGKMSNAEGQWLYIKSYDYNTFQLLDSVQVRNGVISAKLSFDEPTVLLLACKDQRAVSLVNCGVNAFTWDINKPASFSMKDNGVHKDFAALRQRLDVLDKQMIELSKQVRVLADDKQAQDSVLDLKNKVQNTYPLVTRAFIQEHQNSFTSLHLLRGSLTYTHIDTVKAEYARLGKGLKHFPSAKAVQEYLDQEKKLLPLSSLTYSSGKDSLAGFDYYVVDFWGSWCGPCIASIPALKELYEEYHPKNIQFISLAYEKKDLERYHKAQAEHRMSWPQAYVLAQDDEKTLIDEYYITAFPTYLILDKNYQIRHRIIASHEELAAALKKL